jgi:hypothetical protein
MIPYQVFPSWLSYTIMPNKGHWFPSTEQLYLFCNIQHFWVNTKTILWNTRTVPKNTYWLLPWTSPNLTLTVIQKTHLTLNNLCSHKNHLSVNKKTASRGNTWYSWRWCLYNLANYSCIKPAEIMTWSKNFTFMKLLQWNTYVNKLNSILDRISFLRNK